ncbi:FAD-dependent monooxygenase [Streptomyces sp. H10-C2]|uniref:FAD-dependent monooxygenase n=1 Tax=unclassified Streptomyces TaxID=2593676 RepID=UPI0024B92976|nr:MULTISPECIES: FAD-dependent monooxygenase [unclassified Streptomyces]MDJ0346943.1 FAD-dependent monooxygenase [Streptomyces sp. PH10-H1]MDJ0370466.1 FAD-dependent monooxygenase [Streptomyces sp. H10-C2]
MADENVPVLVIGGGLTGLSASVFLTHYGVRSLLIERHPDTSGHPKARAINPRTMEIFRAVGLEDAIRAEESPIKDNDVLVHVETLAGAERVRMPSAAPEDISRISPARWAMIDQNQLEPLLRKQAVATGAEVRFSTQLVSLEEDVDGILATVHDRSTGVTSTIHADYVIAADGSRSPVRRMLRVPDRGRGTITNLVSFFFHADLNPALAGRKVIAAYVNNPVVRGTLIPIDNEKRWVFNVSFYPEQGEGPEDFTERRCLELLRSAIGIHDLPAEIEDGRMLPWEISMRIAEQFRAGRVFIAGDAAHVIPPTGAFGASTGIQDVYNLAWKLSLVLARAAGPGLLDTYGTERRPVALETAKQAGLRFAVREGKRLEDVADELVDETTMTFGYRYRSGAFSPHFAEPAGPLLEDPDHPSAQPGARAPHAIVQVKDGGEMSVVDLFGRGFVLFTSGAADSLAGTAAQAAGRLGVDLVAYRVGPDGDLIDPKGDWASRYKVGDDGAVLVRPDGFVGWRAAGAVPGTADLERALRQLLDLGAG